MNKRDAGNLATWKKNLAFARKHGQLIRIALLESMIAELHKNNLSTRTKDAERSAGSDKDESDS